jgi:hypothetical protein
MSALYLHDELSDISLGTNNTNKAGAAVAWRARVAKPTPETTANVTATVASVTGPTNGLETGNPVNEWISAPLAAAVTISGTIRFNMCARESNAMANAGVGVVVQRLNNVGTVVSTIVDSVQGTELGTTNARRTWTATPTSTAMAVGDRFRIRVYFDDAGGTMVTGYTLTLTYDGTNAAIGDSNVDFAETLSFMSGSSGGLGAFTPVTTGIPTGRIINTVAYANNLFVATATNFTQQTSVYTASDVAGPWSLVGTLPTVNSVARLKYVNNIWIALAGGLYTATNLSGPWTDRTPADANNSEDFVFENNQYVLVGASSGVGAVWFTSDILQPSWTRTTIAGTSILAGIAYGDGLWATCDSSGASGKVYTAASPSGPWTQRTSPTANYTSMYYSNGYWAAGTGSLGVVYTTNPTGTWTLTGSTEFDGLSTDVIVYSASTGFWYTTAGSRLACTSNFTSWTLIDNVLSGSSLEGIALYDTGIFVGGQSGKSAYAPLSSPLFLTDVISSITDQGASVTELTAWTSRGNG